MPLKFINPFNGSPSKLQLTGLFQFHPQTYFDIGGLSLSAAFKLAGKESLLKRMKSIRADDNVRPERVRRLLDELFDAAEVTDSLRRRFQDDLENAIVADERGESTPVSMGLYEAAVAFFNPDDRKLGASQEFFLEIERKSRPALILAYQNKFSAAAEAVLEEDFFAPFLWNGIRDALGKVRDNDSFLPLRASIALEVFLAGMVVYESCYERGVGKDDSSCLLDVWPIGRFNLKNSFGALFDWTKKASGVNTQREFFDHPKLQDVDMDILRLKRWSSGSNQPRKEWLDQLAEGLWGNPDHPPFQMRLAFAQQVNFLGYFSQQLRSYLPKVMTASQAREAYPWPNYPHDYIDFASWGRSRYSFWREYARDYQDKCA